MSVSLFFDERHQVLSARFGGTVTDDILLGSYRRVSSWMDTHGHCSAIADFNDATSFRVTANGIKQLASSSPLAPDSFKRIVVAPQDLVFGMGRMFEILGSNTRKKNVHVVRTAAEAYELLGINSPEFHPVLE